MSKVLPDPQIQSLRAMRAGDIAIALPTPVVSTVGVLPVATAQPIVTMPETAVAVPSDVVLSGTPSETAGVGSAFANTLSQDPAASESFLTANSLEALSGTPNESPVVGVGTATSVV
jgi:hypothetical protein